jgi:hypothetical protein
MVRNYEKVDEDSFVLLLEDTRFAARQLYTAITGLREEDAVGLLNSVLLDTIAQAVVLAQRKGRN